MIIKACTGIQRQTEENQGTPHHGVRSMFELTHGPRFTPSEPLGQLGAWSMEGEDTKYIKTTGGAGGAGPWPDSSSSSD